MNGDDNMRVMQKQMVAEGSGWNLCERSSATRPSDCVRSTGRAGFKSELTPGSVYTWGGTVTTLQSCRASSPAPPATPAPPAACAFEIDSTNAFAGTYINSGETFSGQPIYMNGDDNMRVMQKQMVAEGSGWNLCERSSATGPSDCVRSSGRAGFKSELTPGSVYTWGGTVTTLQSCRASTPALPATPAPPACTFLTKAGTKTSLG